MTEAKLVDVFVPAAGAFTTIDQGSGIVSDPGHRDRHAAAGRTLVDFEGNRMGSESMRTYADRVHIAAGRHLQEYPTVARALLRTGDLVRVATFSMETGEIDLYSADESPEQARARIVAWLGIEDSEVDEQLRTAGSMRHQMLRDIRTAMASGDPTRQFAARQMAKRYKIAL